MCRTMKVRLLTAFFILTVPLLFMPGNAAAVYVGDSGCLICHVGFTIDGYFAPDERSYLMTGHKNMLRKVNTPPSPLTGPDGLAYSIDQSGNTFDWTTNTINILGYCTKSAFSTQSTCVAGGGIWVAGVKNVFYVFDGWMNDAGATSGSPTSVSIAAPRVIYDSTDQGVVQTYSCARCHSTGFTMDSVLQSAKQPEASFPGISWTLTRTTGKVNFDPDGDGPSEERGAEVRMRVAALAVRHAGIVVAVPVALGHEPLDQVDAPHSLHDLDVIGRTRFTRDVPRYTDRGHRAVLLRTAISRIGDRHGP